MLFELLLLWVKLSLSIANVRKYEMVWVKNDDFDVQWTGNIGFMM